MNVVAIVQARMASSRFPGKVLAPMAGVPMIVRVVNRCGGRVKTVVATTTDVCDDALAGFLEGVDVKFYRGSSANPLERMYHAAQAHDADVIVRVTGDCPLVDSRTIETLVQDFRGADLDYLGRTNSPDGNDVQVFSFNALRESYFNASPKQVEHSLTWMRENMRCDSVEGDPRYADVRYSVDTVEDLKTCELLIAKAGEGARWQDYVDAYRELLA